MQESVIAAAQKPIGVLILGRKRPGFDQEWNQIICGRALAALKAMGYATVGAEAVVQGLPSEACQRDQGGWEEGDFGEAELHFVICNW